MNCGAKFIAWQDAHVDQVEVPVTDTAMASETRRRVSDRWFALRTFNPGVGHVDQETFWVIWRDGYNAFAHDSAQLNELFREVAEKIMVMSQADEAAPAMYAAIAIQLLQNMKPLDGDGAWAAVPISTLRRLAREVNYSPEGPIPDDVDRTTNR